MASQKEPPPQPFADAEMLYGGGDQSLASTATWSKLMSQLSKTCGKSNIHDAIRVALLDYSSPDPSSVLKKSPHDLPANRLETLRHAVQRLETEHLPTTENVDSRALQPALKVIANVERDPVLYNALLSHPLIKEGKPQAARKGGKAGSVGSRRKVRPRVNFQEQVCRVLVIGLHNRSLQTVLVGLKALMCLYESSLESKEETLLPESTEVFSVLSSIRLPSWDDYLQMLKQEEEVERSRRVQGQPCLQICSGQASQVGALKVGGTLMAVLRGVRLLPPTRYYYEATLTSISSFATTGSPVWGVRLGWAVCGMSFNDESKVGDASTSFGFDGAKHRLYCNARSRLPSQPDETKGQPSSEQDISGSGARPDSSVGGDDGCGLEGLGGLFLEEEEVMELDVPDGGVEYGSPGEPWKVGDVVGCMIDLEAKTMTYQVNGVVQGETEFGVFDPGEEGVCPAVSISRPSYGVSLNVGHESFRYEPLFRTSGGTLVMKSKADTPTTPGRDSSTPTKTGSTPLTPPDRGSGGAPSHTYRRSQSIKSTATRPQAAYCLPVVQAATSSCLEFDGKGNIEIPFHQVLRLGNGVTVEVLLRVMPPTSPSGRFFLFGSAEFGLEVRDQGELVFHNATGSPPPKLPDEPPKIPLGVWCQVSMVISFETSMLYIYCDGDLLASAPCNNVTKLAGGFAKVLFVAGRPVDGAESGGGDIVDGLKGSVAEIRLWSIPRSPDEILVTRSRSALSGTEERLLGCWRVDEGSSHIIHDTRLEKHSVSKCIGLLFGDFCWAECLTKKTGETRDDGDEDDGGEFRMLTPPRPGDAGDSDEEGDASVKDAKEGPTLRLQVRECIQGLLTMIWPKESPDWPDPSSPVTVGSTLLGVLSHLQSLAQAYMDGSPDPDVSCVLQGLRQQGSTLSVIVKEHVLTMLLLHSLLRQLARLLYETPLVSSSPNSSTSTGAAAISNKSSALSSYCLLTLSLVSVLRLLRANIYHLRSLRINPGFVGLGRSARPDDVARPFSQRLMDILVGFLVPAWVVQDEPFATEAWRSVQSEVGVILCIGLEIFFPTHAERRALISQLLSSEGGDEVQEPPVIPSPLDSGTKEMLLSSVCEALSSLPLAVQFIPPELRSLPTVIEGRPLTLSLTNTNAVLTAVASQGSEDPASKLLVGACVVRGPDWRWGDQDGGAGSVGLVVGLEAWGSSNGHRVRVVWPDGNHNVYRWHVRDNGRLVSDIRPYHLGEEIGDKGGVSQSGKGDEEGVDRRKLDHTLDDVQKALIQPEGRPSLTKRIVLRYMKETAPPKWLEEHGLDASENALVKELTNESVVKLYGEFWGAFAEDNSGSQLSGDSESPAEAGFHEEVEDLKALLQDLLSRLASSAEPSLLTFISALQFVIYGNLAAPKDIAAIKQVDIKAILDSYSVALRAKESKEFRGESGTLLRWDWTDCTYTAADKESDSLDKSEGITTGRRMSTRLDNIRLDLRYCHGTMTTSNNGLTLEQGSEKGWGVALSRKGFARNTGVHRWRVRLDRVNKRGHVFLGVARRSVGLSSFLGNDTSGWGYLQTQDLYHASSLRRRQYGEKLNQGSTVEVVLDTDEGTLSIGDADRGINFGVAFTDLFSSAGGVMLSGSDAIIYPAFSLHHPGDMVTLVSFEGLTTGDDCEAADEEQRSVQMFLGDPHSLLMDYLHMSMDHVRLILSKVNSGTEPELTVLEKALNHPLVSTLVPLALGSVQRWQYFKPSEKAEEVIRRARDLLSVVEGLQRHCLEPEMAVIAHRLEFSLCALLGRLAATEILGPVDQCSNEQMIEVESELTSRWQAGLLPMQTPADKGSDAEAYLKWVRSPLFANGLLQSSKTGGVEKLDELRKLLDDMVEGDGMMNELEKWLGAHVPQQNSMARLGGPHISRAIRAILVAMLYHSGYLQPTIRLASALVDLVTAGDSAKAGAFEARVPPYFLVEAWKKACSLRSWATHIRGQGISYEVTAASIISRVRFLLELSPQATDQPVDYLVEDMITGGDKGAGDLALSSSISVPTPRSSESDMSGLSRSFSGPLSAGSSGSWRLSGGMLRTMAQKQADIVQSVLSFIKEPLSLDIVYIRTLQQAAIQRARSRENGLRLIYSVLRTIRTEATVAKSAILAFLTSALRGTLSSIQTCKNSTQDTFNLRERYGEREHRLGFPFQGCIRPQHYLEGLEGCGTTTLAAVQAAFEALFAYSASELQQQDLVLQLTILDSWGLMIRVEDHDLLARVGLFNILQDILKSTAEEDTVYEGRAAQYVTRATMTLVYLLAMQVATSDGEPQSKSDEAGESEGFKLVRGRSGPATLSESVFRMIYYEMQNILTNLERLSQEPLGAKPDAEREAQSVDLQVLISELTALLLSVCDTPVCRRILSKPPWVSLVLELVRVGPMYAKQRGMRLLRSLLPWCPPQALEDSGEELRIGGDVLSEQGEPRSKSKDLIIFLLELIARPYERATGQTFLGQAKTKAKDISPGVLALSHEALALVETLLPEGKPWSSMVQLVLSECLESVTVFRQMFGEKLEKELLDLLAADADMDVARSMRLGVATLCVLGGQFQFLCPGARAEIGGRPPRRVIVLSLDLNSGMAEVKLDDTAVEEMRLVPTDALRPLRDVNLTLERFPPELTSKVLEMMCLWSFLDTSSVEFEGEPPTSKEEDGGDKKQGEKKSEDEEALVTELFFLICCLQCHALRAVYSLLESPHFAAKMLRLEGSVRKDLLRRLLETAVKPTSAVGLADLATYEEYVQMLLLYRHHLPTKEELEAAEAKAKEEEAAAAEARARSSQMTNLGTGGGGQPSSSREERREEASSPEVDPLVEQLGEMGFPRHWCQRALQETGGQVEPALNWILANGDLLAMEDNSREAMEAAAKAGEGTGDSAAGGDAQDDMEGGSESRRDYWRSSAEGTSWPRVYHYDPLSTSYLTLHAEPSVGSERMGTVFAGDEVVAMSEQGDWLQVKLYYFGEEEDDGKDIDDEDEEDGEEEEEEEEEGVTLVWAQRRTPDGREVLIPGPCPDTDLRIGRGDALSDSMDSFSEEDAMFQRLIRRELAGNKTKREIEVPYRIVEGAEVAVRRGIEPMSSIVGMLTSGTVTAVEESVDSRGSVRLRIISPLRGWIPKLPGLVELIGPGGESKEAGGIISTENLTEEEAFARLEDCLEQEVGQELFRKEERYFAGRLHGGASSTRIYQQLYGYQTQDNGVGVNKGNKRLRFFGQNSVQAVWQSLASLSARELDKRLREKVQMMVTLHGRQVILGLLLHWTEGTAQKLGDSVTPETRTQLAPIFSAGSTAEGEEVEKIEKVAREQLPSLLEKFVRLVAYRGFSESGWEGKFARFWGSSYASLFEDSTCLDLIPHVLRSLPALLSPVIQALLLSAEYGRRTALAEGLEDELMKSITRQLQLAASPVYSDVSWADTSYQDDDDDKEALNQPNIQLIRWLSRILYETSRNARGWELDSTADASASSTVLRLFKAWAASMKSPGLSLKLQAALELGHMLADVVMAFDAAESTTGTAAAAKTAKLRFLLKEMLALLPARRLRRLTANRLGLENEDAPMYSRFLQSLIELVTFMDLARNHVNEGESGLTVAEEKEIEAGCTDAHETVEGKQVSKRSVIKFSSSDGSHILVETSREWLDPPWTAEFWIYRNKEPIPEPQPEPSASPPLETESSGNLSGPGVPPVRNRGRGGRRVSPGPFLPPPPASISENIPEPPSLPPLSESSLSSSLSAQSQTLGPPPQLLRTRSTGPSETALVSNRPLEMAATTAVTTAGVGMGTPDMTTESKDSVTLSTDEFLLLNAEDFPALGAPREAFRPSNRGFSTGIGQRGLNAPRRGRGGRVSARIFGGAWDERALGKVDGTIDKDPNRKDKSLPSMYLARSSTYAIKLQSGGNIVGLESKDDEEPVAEQALCLSVSVCGEPDRAFDYVVPTERWVHLAFIAKRSPRSPELTLLADGEVIGTIPVKLGLPLQMVGGMASESFSGYLSRVRYWNYDRTPDEIRRDMNCHVSEATNGLLACWGLTEGTGSYIGECTNTFRSCTARNCEWEQRTDVPAFSSSLSMVTEYADLLYPKEEIGDEGETARILELSGWFERDSVTGVEGQWGSTWREPCVLRYRVTSGPEPSTESQPVHGVVEWPEKRLKALLTGSLKEETRLEFSVTQLLEGCPAKHGWVVGLQFSGAVSDSGRELEGKWEVVTNLVRKKPVGLGEMRIEAGAIADEVNVSEEGMAVARTDLGGSRTGCLVTVEVCPFPPFSHCPDTYRKLLSGEVVEALTETAEAEVSGILAAFTEKDESAGGSVVPMLSEGGGAASTYGYTKAKWCWEWKVVTNASGNIGFGVSSSRVPPGPLNNPGKDEDSWMYFSSGEMLHGGRGPDGQGSTQTFGAGDVIGLELDLDEGTIRFYKNDRDSGFFFNAIHLYVRDNVEASPPGLRPCVCLGGPSDKVRLLGLKSGYGKRIYPPSDPFLRSEYQGQWKYGLRHGAGVLRYRNMRNFWRGIWWQDSQHGVQLYVEADEQGRQTKATPFLFYQDVKVGEANNDDAADALAAWERERPPEPTLASSSEGRESKSKDDLPPLVPPPIVRPPPPPSDASDDKPHSVEVEAPESRSEASETLSMGTASEKTWDSGVDSPRVDLSLSELSAPRAPNVAVDQGGLPREAPYLVRIIYEGGATVRNGVEIDLADAVRTLAVGTVVEAYQRVVTAEGTPRLQIADGWISERLRGGAEDPVVEVLRHTPATPLRYRIRRLDGAMVRRGMEKDSEEVGLIPHGTIIEVSERRRIADGTMRLKIISPPAWLGWASEKDQLVEREESAEAEKDREIERQKLVRGLREQERKRRAAAAAKAEDERKRTVRATVKGSAKVSSKTFFHLDRMQCSPGIKVADDFLTATFDRSISGKAMVLGTRGFRQGMAYWEVKVEHANWGSVFIGVAPKTTKSWQGFGFLNYRAVQAYGSETLYGSYFTNGDTIGVLLDMDRGTIAFIKDGEDFNVGRPVVINMGVAYHYLRRGTRDGIPGPMMYPCFGMKGTGDQLTIRNCKWYCTRGNDRWTQLQNVEDSLKVMYQWWRHVHYGTPLSLDAVSTIHLQYKGWKSRRRLRYVARGGGEVEVDCTADALKAAAGTVADMCDLEIGMRATTPYGEARLVGVARGDIWYALDADGGKVWYWTTSEFEDLVGSSRVVLAPHNAKAGGGENEASTDGTATTITGAVVAPPGPLERTPSVPGVGTTSEFLNLINGGQWTPDADEALVRLVNSVSNRLGLPATHIPFPDLEQALHSVTVGPLAPLVESRGNSGMTPALARFAAILWLNRAVSVCVPFVNLGLPSDRPVITTDYDQQACRDIPALSLEVMSPLGRMLSSLRGSIFTSSKMALWQDALTESTTFTLPPADEYERPEELREVVLNRMQSRRGLNEAESLTYQERLRLSLFGQLREHMISWEDRVLRRSFVHMQDAGQPRAFYVKFTGEGVDDHGGPYRAVFETAVGEEPVGPLELFLPCPNEENRIGENRDQYIINPISGATAGELRLPLYHHLGRLMGVATRHRVLVPLSLPALVWKPVAGEVVGRKELQAVDKFLVRPLIDVENKRIETTVEETRSMLMSTLGKAAVKFNSKDVGPDMEGELPLMVKMVEQAKLTEGLAALSNIVEGMSGILPVELFSMFTPSEVEAIVCGVPVVDISILQKATDYEGVSPRDPHIQAFWEVLEELTSEDRRDFVNFCSGRSRLPPSAADFPMNFKLTAPQPRFEDHPDDYLPLAQTCFFSLSLPRYSSKEVCKEKLLYAIKNCNLMDADFLIRN